MLRRAAAYEVVRQAMSGRTKPVVMRCEADGGRPPEMFCKLSAGCEEGVLNLAREAVAACLAADLRLPVPAPFLVEIPPELASVATEPDVAARLAASSSVAFGSLRAASQFSVWTAGHRVTEAMLPHALGAFVFDAVIDNVDRKLSNPNCLVAGDCIRLIDHELAFPSTATIVNWQAPWRPDGLGWMNGHIFFASLRRRSLDFGPLRKLWDALSDMRLREYRNAIPPEWSEALSAVDAAIDRVRSARDNIDGIISEARQVLQ